MCVDYHKIHVPRDDDITAPVVQLTADKAGDLLSSLFTTQPASAERIFATESWTLAIIEDLKVQDLRPWALDLGSGQRHATSPGLLDPRERPTRGVKARQRGCGRMGLRRRKGRGSHQVPLGRPVEGRR